MNTPRIISVSVSAVLMGISAILGYYSSSLPDSYFVEKGETLTLSTALNIEACPENLTVPSYVSDNFSGSDTNTLKLFGVIPIKDVEVTSVNTPLLTVGGNPFGIKLLMDGVMVVGVGAVDGGRSPAEEAGIRTGDIIVSVNGEDINSNVQLQDAIQISDGSSSEIPVIINRNGIESVLNLEPVFSEADGSYKAGMWVRDSSAGIGTITFYEQESGCFGGLGHPICDIDTGEIIPISRGEVVPVSINGVKKGVAGSAGELQGCFTSDKACGSLSSNNIYGVFGTLDKSPNFTQPIPMGLKQDVHTGSATIMTTVDGTEPEEYSIEIEKIDYKNSEGSKNMIIRITDEKLLAETGGIVQGMSGSPIIQDGKLIGAVTHVFVNEPERGYAVFSENMYEFGKG